MSIVKRDGTGESTWDGAAPPPGSIVRTQENVLLKAMSEYMATQWQESVLMSMAHITIRKEADVPGQVIHQGPHECPGALEGWLHWLTAAALVKTGPVSQPSSIVELL